MKLVVAVAVAMVISGGKGKDRGRKGGGTGRKGEETKRARNRGNAGRKGEGKGKKREGKGDEGKTCERKVRTVSRMCIVGGSFR